jgi:hypothetical protein
MKRILLSFYLIVFFVDSNAQSNNLFPDSAAQWSVKEWDGFGNAAGFVYYYFDTDTVINSQTYHKILVLNQSSWMSPSTGYHAAIRKDLAAKKVYVVPKDSVNEFLFYDFSGSAGDTVHNVYSEMDFVTPTLSDVKISSVDSVQDNGVWLKKFQVQNISGFGNSDWTEMAGSSGGLFTGISPATLSSTAQLSCMSYDDTLYPYYGVGYCVWFITGIPEPDKSFSFTVSPNPGNGMINLHLKNENQQESDIEILNTLGEIVFSKKLNSLSLAIDISDLPGGIYFINVVNGKNSSRMKIIRNAAD